MTPAAARQRRYRARQRAGRISIRLQIDHVTVAESLIEVGLLAAADYDDPKAIARGLEQATIIIAKRNKA